VSHTQRAAFVAWKIEDTGDHPLNWHHCPGLHRAPWTIDGFVFDATWHLLLVVVLPRAAHRRAAAAAPATEEIVERAHAVQIATDLYHAFGITGLYHAFGITGMSVAHSD
jgi:hypothetical protein